MRKVACLFVVLLAACGHGRRPDTGGLAVVPPPLPNSIGDPPPIPPNDVVPVKATSAVADTVELPPAKRIRTPGEVIAEVNEALQDAYFAYDRDEISAEALAALRRDAELLCGILAEFPGVRVVVEGHCDERGSAEYNLGLGDRRARRALAVLHDFGVAASAVDVVSYGKESPQCTQSTEACYQKNRRAHLSVRAPETR